MLGLYNTDAAQHPTTAGYDVDDLFIDRDLYDLYDLSGLLDVCYGALSLC